jgi:hypothetical protein
MLQHYLQIIVVDSDKDNHLTIHPFSIKPDIVGRLAGPIPTKL